VLVDRRHWQGQQHDAVEIAMRAEQVGSCPRWVWVGSPMRAVALDATVDAGV
jgi:hypothetical protein